MSAVSRNAALMVLMMAVAIASPMLRATDRLADQLPPLRLESMIPTQFGDWKELTNVAQQVVDPEVQQKLDTIYGQTLARTYGNPKGQRVMLSIAYGANQGSDDFQAHKPEYCYSAQGFQLQTGKIDVVKYKTIDVPIQRLEATQGRRHEPISYWITIGSKATLPGVRRKLAQLQYGLSGTIPDGMLIRVSSIGPIASTEYKVHDNFIASMLDSMPPADQARMIGSPLKALK